LAIYGLVNFKRNGIFLATPFANNVGAPETLQPAANDCPIVSVLLVYASAIFLNAPL
jgi:hypothetical protein